MTLADFQFSATDEIIACPAGQPPQRLKIGQQGGLLVHFAKDLCDSCPQQSGCPVKREKKRCTLRYDAKSLRLARRRKHEQTIEFKDRYRYRAGAEATMSDLDRVTGIKHLRVRGMRQVSLAATLKATGLNIHRATAFRIRKRRPKGSPKRANSAEKVFILTIPERFKRLWNDVITSYSIHYTKLYDCLNFQFYDLIPWFGQAERILRSGRKNPCALKKSADPAGPNGDRNQK